MTTSLYEPNMFDVSVLAERHHLAGGRRTHMLTHALRLKEDGGVVVAAEGSLGGRFSWSS
jgi:hypothetical protein